MSYSKTLVSSDLGSVCVEESAGVVSLTGSANADLGGGEAAGAVGVKASVALTLSVKQCADLLCGLLAAKIPSLSAEISVLQAAIDAELAKL